MSYFKKEDVLFQRFLLELEYKRVLVNLYDKAFIGSYDEITQEEVIRNLRDLGIVHLMLDKCGKFSLNKGVLKEHQERTFIKLFLELLGIEENIEKLDNVYKSGLCGKRRKGVFLDNEEFSFFNNEIRTLYATDRCEIVSNKHFIRYEGAGLLGCFYECKNLDEFVGCPLSECDEGYLVPLRNVKNGVPRTCRDIDVKEIDFFDLNSLLNSLSFGKYSCFIWGKIPEDEEAIKIKDFWEAISDN